MYRLPKLGHRLTQVYRTAFALGASYVLAIPVYLIAWNMLSWKAGRLPNEMRPPPSVQRTTPTVKRDLYPPILSGHRMPTGYSEGQTIPTRILRAESANSLAYGILTLAGSANSRSEGRECQLAF